MHRQVRKTTALLVAVALFIAASIAAYYVFSNIAPGKSVSSVSYSLKAPDQDRHDIDIISVDFDPPLAKDGIAPTSLDKTTLLVAVDNRGNKIEKDLNIEAKLMGEHESDLIDTESQTIDALAPGEAKVVRFPFFRETQARPSYLVKVEVTSKAGQAILGNSSKLIRLSFEPR